MGREHDVTVASSDGLEQLIIRGQGANYGLQENFMLRSNEWRKPFEDKLSERKAHYRKAGKTIWIFTY